MLPFAGTIKLRGATGSFQNTGIASEFGIAPPAGDAISEYYRGGAHIVLGSNLTIPTSGTVKFSDYYGAMVPVVAPPTPGPGGVVTPQPPQPVAPTAIPVLGPDWPKPSAALKYCTVTFYRDWTRNVGWETVVDLNDVFENGPFTAYDIAYSNRRDRAPIQPTLFRITAAGLLQINIKRDLNMHGETINVYVENAVGRSVEYLIVTAAVAGTTYTHTTLPLLTASGGQPQPKPPASNTVPGSGGTNVGATLQQGSINSGFVFNFVGTIDWTWGQLTHDYHSSNMAVPTDGYGFALNTIGVVQVKGGGPTALVLVFSGRPTGANYTGQVTIGPLTIPFNTVTQGAWHGDIWQNASMTVGTALDTFPLPMNGHVTVNQI